MSLPQLEFWAQACERQRRRELLATANAVRMAMWAEKQDFGTWCRAQEES